MVRKDLAHYAAAGLEALFVCVAHVEEKDGTCELVVVAGCW